jgi:hypothetical protein
LSLSLDTINMREFRLTPLPLWLLAAAAMTAGALIAYAVSLQIERQSANDPQIQLTEDGAAALEKGRPIAQIVPTDTIDVARSLAPFLIVLDDAGKPLASSGLLDGQVPIPPPGVLAFVRDNGEERVTWAPRPGLRLASVVRRVGGQRPGFIVAARSLREVQSRIARLTRIIVVGWAISLLGLTAGVAVMTWISRR